MADWEDTVLSNRRIPHGKSRKGGNNRSGPSASLPFDPRKALGSYTLTGPGFERLLDSSEAVADFEIHHLTPLPGGLAASIIVGTKIQAAVLLAGSRSRLAEVVQEAECKAEPSASDEEEESESETDPKEKMDDYDDDSSSSAGQSIILSADAKDRRNNAIFKAFEKNSFRSPKFWLQWQGNTSANEAAPSHLGKNTGYIVFSTKACKDFTGTLTSPTLGWDNVTIHGKKVTGKPRPAPFAWADFMPNSTSASETSSTGSSTQEKNESPLIDSLQIK